MSHKDEDIFYDEFKRAWLDRFGVLNQIKPEDSYKFVQTLRSYEPIRTKTKAIYLPIDFIIHHLFTIELLANDIFIFHVKKVMKSGMRIKPSETVKLIDEFPYFQNPERWVSTTSIAYGRDGYKEEEMAYYGYISKWWESFLGLNKKDRILFRGKDAYICWSSIVYNLTFLDASLVIFFEQVESKKAINTNRHPLENKSNRYRIYSQALEEIFYTRYRKRFKFDPQKIKNLFDNDCRKKGLRRAGFYDLKFKNKIDSKRFKNSELRKKPFSFNNYINLCTQDITKALFDVLKRTT
jgi:hypothetical protein